MIPVLFRRAKFFYITEFKLDGLLSNIMLIAQLPLHANVSNLHSNVLAPADYPSVMRCTELIDTRLSGILHELLMLRKLLFH